MNESEETEEVKTFPSTPSCCNGSRPCPTVSQYQLDATVTLHNTFASPNHPISWNQDMCLLNTGRFTLLCLSGDLKKWPLNLRQVIA